MPLTSTGNYMHQPPPAVENHFRKDMEFTPQHTYHYTTRTNPPRDSVDGGVRLVGEASSVELATISLSVGIMIVSF